MVRFSARNAKDGKSEVDSSLNLPSYLRKQNDTHEDTSQGTHQSPLEMNPGDDMTKLRESINMTPLSENSQRYEWARLRTNNMMN